MSNITIDKLVGGVLIVIGSAIIAFALGDLALVGIATAALGSDIFRKKVE